MMVMSSKNATPALHAHYIVACLCLVVVMVVVAYFMSVFCMEDSVP
jgi:Flp pilus assembly protein TadB